MLYVILGGVDITRCSKCPPKVTEVVIRGLLCAEVELAIARFSSASTVDYVRESNLTLVSSLSARKHRVGCCCLYV
jgi:hypothetical protein